MGNDTAGYPATDPTTLTTTQLAREITHLREFIETRLDAMDKAVVLLQEFANRQPTIGEVVAASNEQFKAIEDKFYQRDLRFDLRDVDAKAAVHSALTAAKEAVAKSETSFTKQIDQIGNIINSQAVTLDDKIADIRNRLVVVESRTSNGHALPDLGLLTGVAALVVVLVSVIGYALFGAKGPSEVVRKDLDTPVPTYQVQPPSP